MSETRNFNMGNATIFQDKSSKDTALALKLMHSKDHSRALDLVDTHPREIAEMLVDMDRSEADLAIVLKTIVREYHRLKQEKENK